MKSISFLILLFFVVNMAKAQPKKWELVKSAPDTCNISPNVKAISNGGLLYLYQMSYSTAATAPLAAPLVSVSQDGIHFTPLGTLDPSLGKIEPLFAWKSEIYLRSIETRPRYFKTTDGLNLEEFLPKDISNKYLIPVAFGVVRDTLYAYCQHFQKGNTTWRDSLFFMANDKKWQSAYGKVYSTNELPVVTSGQLLLSADNSYLDFTSLRKAPRTIPKASISFYDQRWNVGQYIVSYKANVSSPLLLTDIKAQVTLSVPLPAPLHSDVFNLLVMPDSSIVVQTRKSIPIPGNSGFPYLFNYQTYDYGNTWKAIDSFPDSWANKGLMSVYEHRNAWYIANQQFPFLRSLDKGQNWTKEMLYGTRWNTAFSVADGKMMMNNKYFSQDDGKTWSTYDDAFENMEAEEIYWKDHLMGWMVKPLNSTQIYQLVPGMNSPQLTGIQENTNYFKEALLVQNQIVYLYRGGYADPMSGWFYKLNAGKQWILYSDLEDDLQLHPPMSMMSDGHYLYCYDLESYFLKGVFVSSNVGQTWDLLTRPALLLPDKKPIYTFYDDKNKNQYMSIREHDGLSAANTIIDTLRVFKLTPTGYVPVAANGFAKQPVRQNEAHGAFDKLIGFPSGTMYSWSQALISRDVRLFKSVDQGENWERINTDEIKSTVLSIGEDQQGRMYIATNNGLYREEQEEDVITDNVNVSVSSKPGLMVYPNPASTGITIVADKMENVQVIDLLGNTLISAGASDNQVHLDISRLPQGIYLIKTETASAKLLIR